MNTQDIQVVRARTQSFELSVTDASGSPKVLASGEKYIFGVKRTANDTSYVLSKEITSANATQVSGTYSFEITPSDTEDLSFGDYVYDIGFKQNTKYYPVIDCSIFTLSENVTVGG